MSTAMMSAPSWASLIAWLRPWLRAAPVMKATLPATRPAMSAPLLLTLNCLLELLTRPPLARRCLPGAYPGRLLDHGAGVGREGHAGDVAALVRGEEQHRVADVDRLDPGDRQRVHRLRGRGEVFPRRVLEVGAE